MVLGFWDCSHSRGLVISRQIKARIHPFNFTTSLRVWYLEWLSKRTYILLAFIQGLHFIGFVKDVIILAYIIFLLCMCILILIWIDLLIAGCLELIPWFLSEYYYRLLWTFQFFGWMLLCYPLYIHLMRFVFVISLIISLLSMKISRSHLN